MLPVLGQEPFVSQGRSDVFGQVSSCLCSSVSELLRNILFSTCISQIHLDRHKFEFLSPNTDTALKLSINSDSVNSHTTREVIWLCRSCGRVWNLTVKPKGPKL